MLWLKAAVIMNKVKSLRPRLHLLADDRALVSCTIEYVPFL